MKKKRYYMPCIETVLVVEAMTIMAGSNETGFGPGVEKPGDGEKTTSMVIPINQVESQRMAIPNAFKRLRNTLICGMCVWYA